jgi:hypothetical protein
MKILNPLFLLLVLSFNGIAQTDNVVFSNSSESSSNSKWNSQETEVKNILGLQVGITDPTVGMSYERLFSPNFGAEFTIGLIGVSIGPKFYLPALSSGKLTFHTGLIVGAGFFAEGTFGYLPIGISRLTKGNLLISFDIGPHTGNAFSNIDSKVSPGARLKIGKAF